MNDSTEKEKKPTFQDTLLLEEYKLIQGKIDKLGEDKFKVRNWCFTVVTGALAVAKLSGSLDSSGSVYILLGLFIPAIAAFQLVELRQRKVASQFADRAHCIELILRKQHSSIGNRDTAAPGLAWHIIQHGNRERKRCSFKNWISSKFGFCQQTTRSVENEGKNNRPSEGKPPSLLDCLTFRADKIFYHVLYFIICVFVVLLFVRRQPVPEPSERKGSNLIMQFNSNGFHLFVRQANVVVTNFIPITKLTTNFETVVQYSTNFIVTDIYVTNNNVK